MTNLTILYVDDDAKHREIVAEALGNAGHYVTQAPTATAALELLQRGRYDCVVTDYDMPGVSGARVVQEARNVHPGATVCVVSGHRKEDMQDLPAGTMLLRKPFSVPFLLDLLTPR